MDLNSSNNPKSKSALKNENRLYTHRNIENEEEF